RSPRRAARRPQRTWDTWIFNGYRPEDAGAVEVLFAPDDPEAPGRAAGRTGRGAGAPSQLCPDLLRGFLLRFRPGDSRLDGAALEPPPHLPAVLLQSQLHPCRAGMDHRAVLLARTIVG